MYNKYLLFIQSFFSVKLFNINVLTFVKIHITSIMLRECYVSVKYICKQKRKKQKEKKGDMTRYVVCTGDETTVKSKQG